jgi:arsenate reductase
LRDKKTNILCVCIHNSARSQIAETYLNSLSSKINAKSAGLTAGILNPLVVKSMLSAGYDISSNKTKTVESIFKDSLKFDFVIFVCEESQAANCPVVPYEAEKIYWSIKDPSVFEGNDSTKLEEIKIIRDKIKIKVKEFIKSYIKV